MGEPGCGKSRYVAEHAGASLYYKTRGEWWDLYSNEESVVFDDFYGWLQYDELLRVCDRYPHKVPIKGGFLDFTSKKIYFTSNTDVENWYKFEKFDPAALFRRITKYLWFDHCTKAFIDRPAFALPHQINY